jgi:16S rRNA processing protein RimM
MEKIIVGKVIKPQGIKGELKIIVLADTPEIFSFLEKVYIDNVEYKILSARIADGVYLVLKGIADRNQAELFRNKMLFVDREDIPLPDGRWFVTDIIGCEVSLDDGTLLGTVSDITTRGSTDIYTVDLKNGKAVVFPFLNDLVLSVSVEDKKIVLNKSRLAEVGYYED